MNLQANKAGIYPIYQKLAHAIGLSTPPPPPIGCVLYMPGLPGAGNKIYDRSPYGNHGTITGATWKRLPSGLWCLDFDGTDDNGDCGDADVFSFTDGAGTDKPFTMLVWIKPDVPWASGDIISKRLSTTTLEYFLTFSSNGTAYLRLYNSGGTINNLTKTLDDAIEEGKWVLMGATYDGSEVHTGLILYKNGLVADATGAETGTYTGMGNSSAPLTIGARSGGAPYFDGGIALPRIYNRALSALEIQNHFNREKHLFGVW